MCWCHCNHHFIEPTADFKLTHFALISKKVMSRLNMGIILDFTNLW